MNLQPNEVLRIRAEFDGKITFELKGYYPRATLVNTGLLNEPTGLAQKIRFDVYTLQHSVIPARAEFLMLEIMSIVDNLQSALIKFKRDQFGCI